MLDRKRKLISKYLLEIKKKKKFKKVSQDGGGFVLKKKATGTAQPYMEAGPEHLTCSKKSFLGNQCV